MSFVWRTNLEVPPYIRSEPSYGGPRWRLRAEFPGRGKRLRGQSQVPLNLLPPLRELRGSRGRRIVDG